MDSRILLGKILQRFSDLKVSQVENYNSFEYIRETKTSVWLTREAGQNTEIKFSKLIIAIEAFQLNPDLYDAGPSKLKEYGISHINSPIWSLLHLLNKDQYF